MPAATIRETESICRTLGGLPLAIEIAAAQLPFMSIDELQRRVTAARASPQSGDEPSSTALAAMIDWSWATLDPGRQALLARLSVFEGGCTIDAAEAVCRPDGDVADDMSALVDRGLVISSERYGATRFEMLEPVRSFTTQRLANRHETDVTRDRMVAWIRGLVKGWSVPDLHACSEASDILCPRAGKSECGAGPPATERSG